MIETGNSITLRSGRKGWRHRLRDNYHNDFSAWETCADCYGLADRLGMSIEEAWEENPIIEGSVDPTDFGLAIDDFTLAYINAMLWSSTDEAGEPLDSNFSVSDLAAETLAKCVKDCSDFLAEMEETIEAAECSRCSDWTKMEMAGHDFWLNRNGHGAGFWDGDWCPAAAAVALDKASKRFGEIEPWVVRDGTETDGWIYFL